jgi:hypothetical protein
MGSGRHIAYGHARQAGELTIARVANQQSDALQKSNSAASELSLARFDLRIIRAMQSSARPRHDG